jgi:hypothetical protein
VSTKSITFALLTSLSLLTAGCGVYDQGSSSSVVRIIQLEASSGAKPDVFGGTLNSDVTTMVKRDSVDVPTIFNDLGRVSMLIALKDPGSPGIPSQPSPLNAVTFTHYRVEYRRTDGHNVQGVDVPYAFDSGLTFTVPPDGTIQVGFEIVRHTAKEDGPLKALQVNHQILNTVADVTFFGKDQAGKSVQVTGSIGINFGDFGDPTT